MSPSADTGATSCGRFEREGLLLLEQGQPLDPHFDTCADCRAVRAEYEALQAGIGDLGRAYAGRTDWQARVFAGVARMGERRASPWRWLVWLGAPAVLTAAVLLLLLRPVSGPESSGPVLALAFHRPGEGVAVMRGEHVRPGDVLDVTIRTGGAAHAELRVYRDDQALLVRCTDRPPCVRSDDGLTASIRLEERGRYQIALLYGPQSLPAPGAGLDDDLARARAAGATVELRELDVL